MKQITKNIETCKYDINTVKNAIENFIKLSFSKNKLSKESVLDLISELEKNNVLLIRGKVERRNNLQIIVEKAKIIG